MRIEHFSWSQLSCLERCGEQYRRRYLCHDKIPPGIAQIRGIASDSARTLNLTQKVSSKVDLPEEAVVQAAIEQSDNLFAGSVLLTPDIAETPLAKLKGETKDLVAKVAALDYETFQVATQPVLVQQKLTAQINGLPELIGIPDLVDSEKMIRDLKVSGKSNKRLAQESTQLTFQAMLLKLNNIQECGVGIDLLVHTPKGKVSAQTLRSIRDESDFKALIARIEIALEIVEKEVWAPCPPDHWACDPRYCGYWNTCRYAHGKERKGGEKNG